MIRRSQTHTQAAALAAAVPSDSDTDPLTVEEVKASSEWPQWQDTIREEYNSLLENNTFSPIPMKQLFTDEVQPIGNKWVFKTKLNTLASPGRLSSIRYKARLVIKGYEQRYGIDYEDTYAPVGKLITLRYLLSLAAQNRWKIHQLDVITAFLNPAIDNEVYMALPDGIEWLDSSPGSCIATAGFLRLNKALYGLKQAPKLWFEDINSFLLSLDFVQSQADPNLYMMRGALLLFYVDDTMLFQTDETDCALRVKRALNTKYKMTDLGKAKKFLGLEIEYHSDGGISISQEAYINKVLRRFGMHEAHGLNTPLDPNVKLDITDGDTEADTELYQSIMGSLMYISLGTRPDLAYAVAALSRYNSAPLATHMASAKRVLRYLCKTSQLCLHFPASNDGTGLLGYTDSDWASDSHDRKSQGGYFFSSNGSSISWQSKKQGLVAMSTVEAEYIACSEAAREAQWLRQLETDIFGIADTIPPLNTESSAAQSSTPQPLTIQCDNQGTITNIVSGASKARTKHIDVRYHNCRDLQSQGTLAFTYVHMDDNVADIMTKALPADKHRKLTALMGLQ